MLVEFLRAAELNTNKKGNIPLKSFRETTLAVDKRVLHIFQCVCVRARVRSVCVCARAQTCACARIALLIQYATRTCQIVIYGVSGSAIFFDIIT